MRAFGMNTGNAVARGLRFYGSDREIFYAGGLFSKVDLPTFGRPTMAADPGKVLSVLIPTPVFGACSGGSLLRRRPTAGTRYIHRFAQAAGWCSCNS